MESNISMFFAAILALSLSAADPLPDLDWKVLNGKLANWSGNVEPLPDGSYAVGCRTWRLIYTVDPAGVHVRDVRSNYRMEELAPEADDPYGDKDFHRKFRKEFGDAT